MSDKFEYFTIRNSVGIIDTSPLYKYRISGGDAERFLRGLLVRDVGRCPPGHAQYNVWCDDDGWVVEDGVVMRLDDRDYLLTTAGPNLAYLEDMASPYTTKIEDVSEEYAALTVAGPRSREVLQTLSADVAMLATFDLTETSIGKVPTIVSRTGFTGDLGYELWIPADQALAVWDRLVDATDPHRGAPCGQDALLITRIEAGLLLLDVDYRSARYAWNDDQRSTLSELGLGWMLAGLGSDTRRFVGRRAIETELAEKASRWRIRGIVVDWEDWQRVFHDRGLIPPKDHSPQHGVMMIYEPGGSQVGWVSSFVYSPVLQEHIGIARLDPPHSRPGSRARLEVTIDHRYDTVGCVVTRLPFYDPPRRRQ